jgi:hypothetical protein
MKDLKLPPFAPMLMESMRAIGYSLDTAIADLVDNSISAEATSISIVLPPGPPSFFAILDDGNGMSAAELQKAMRHGSQSPNDARPAGDLGRFGLGLKTASLSQCRRLVVVSKKANKLSALAWDIDHVIETGDWNLQVLEGADIKELPLIERLRAQESGTLVLWMNLDRASAGDATGTVLSERVDQARRHLSLVFHRYLRPSDEGTVEMDINGVALKPVDPFLSKHNATIQERPELIDILGSKVRVEAFTLPHISHLTREEIDLAGGREDLRREQGFYVYRNRRLIVWGTWFQLYKQDELSKLTRVMVDVANDLDHEWTLDIKKSVAAPPEILKKRLRELVPRMCKPSHQAHQYRGRRTSASQVIPVWDRIEQRDGSVAYRVSRDHPAAKALLGRLDNSERADFGALLTLIEDCFPAESLYNDRAKERMGHRASAPVEDEMAERLEQMAMSILGAAEGDKEGRKNLLQNLDRIEPFNLYPDLTKRIRERLAP